MKYRSAKNGRKVSVLGYGCMRFTQRAGGIDIAKAETEIMEAYRAGVNYYDTAYIYPGSEAAIGEIFERNGIRDDIIITTKLPHYLLKDVQGAEKYFAEELRRLRTDHVDNYLMHMLNDISAWERLEKLGIREWLDEKKRLGQIGSVGFSYHGNSDMFCRLLDAYDWDLCQIQYNYLDENTQAGRTGLEYARKKGVPVVIMEPLRGGKLATGLPNDAAAIIAAHEPKMSPAQWGLRWLWDQEGIMCVLSGMNSVDMVRENAAAAEDADPGFLSEADRAMFEDLAAIIRSNMKVGCTGCRYCMPCPHGVDIPGIFAAYNRTALDGRMQGIRELAMTTAIRGNGTGPENCVSCGKCELHCPQHIEIRKMLREARAYLQIPGYGTGVRILKRFMRYK
ncbi:MAG: aldo/keto reductase [Firmicutes bacterium]|nr:aldo/keto reductase [Bacillota bacterium]